MLDNIQAVVRWIRNDYKAYPKRFCLEVTAWMISLCCSVTMAMTVPNPPLFPIYFFWIVGCCIYGWAAWTRKSFGILANYVMLAMIDVIGFTRMAIYYATN